jgi:peptidyl-prolyl cis-trans isomerase D
MLSFFRRISKSKIGTSIIAAVGLAILAGFALSDISNFGSGTLGFGLSSSTLAEVGSAKVTDNEMSDAMQKHLQDVRQQNPEADYADIVGDFDALLDQLLDQKAIAAFTDKFDFPISKRLIDADIAQIPGVRGLNGKPSVQSYEAFLARARLTDAEVRDIIAAQIAARTLILPVATQARVPTGVASQYAAMLLEARQGEAAVLPVTLFTAGLKPTDSDVQSFYSSHKKNYIVPEQRSLRFALMTPDSLKAAAPTDQEIAAYYQANQATYGANETRTLSQAVVPDQKTAQAIYDAAKRGATIAAAAAPAGKAAAVSTITDKTREEYAGIAGDRAALAAFTGGQGDVIGPIESDFGWIVAKVDSVKKVAGKTLAQARPEIVTKLTADKSKTALADLYNKAQDLLDGGHNLTEVASKLNLPVTTTPLVTADGTSRADPNFKLGPNLAPVVKAGFDIAPSDEPEIATLANDGGFAIVSPNQVVQAAPAPLASIRDRVANDWIQSQAMLRAQKAAEQIAAKAGSGMSVADAVKQSGLNAPVQPLSARRIQIAQSKGPVAPAIRTLFTLTAGKSRAVPDEQGRGFFVIKVDKITPGNALMQPGLIGGMSHELQRATEDEYARQFLAAIRANLKVKMNPAAITELKHRLLTGGS